jgi:hypothetical protein
LKNNAEEYAITMPPLTWQKTNALAAKIAKDYQGYSLCIYLIDIFSYNIDMMRELTIV